MFEAIPSVDLFAWAERAKAYRWTSPLIGWSHCRIGLPGSQDGHDIRDNETMIDFGIKICQTLTRNLMNAKEKKDEDFFIEEPRAIEWPTQRARWREIRQFGGIYITYVYMLLENQLNIIKNKKKEKRKKRCIQHTWLVD